MNKKKWKRIILYVFAIYLALISILEVLATLRIIKVPYSDFLYWFNGIILLAGGFIIGIIFLRMKGTWNKIIGWFFILDNIIMLRLLFEALG